MAPCDLASTLPLALSIGALGYYAEQVAAEGLIALVFATSPEFVHPAGSSEAIFGTNPIGVGIPTKNGPVVLDMATSAYSFFGEAWHVLIATSIGCRFHRFVKDVTACAMPSHMPCHMMHRLGTRCHVVCYAVSHVVSHCRVVRRHIIGCHII